MIEGPRTHPKLTRIPGLLLASLFGAGPVGAAAPSFDDESVRAAAAFAEALDAGDTAAAHAQAGWPHSKLGAGEFAARIAFERGDLGAAQCRDVRMRQDTGLRADGTASGHLVVLAARFAQGWAQEWLRVDRGVDGTLTVADYVVAPMDRDGDCSGVTRRYGAGK